MPRIYVKFSGLQQLETTCSDASATLSEIQSDFQKTVRQLDWDVRLQSDINRTASRLSGKLSSYTAALKKYQSFLNDAHSAYQELDVMLRCDRSIDCSGTGKVLWILWNG